ncbi:MAG TPA: AMP-binding protein [Acidimicrobiales bacterium]
MADLPPDPLAAYAAAVPDRPAVVDDDGRVATYADLNAEVNRLVGGLAALGFGGGERAVWCAPNSRQVLAFMHACRKLGLVAVPLSYRFTAEEMHHVLSDSGAVLVVVDAAQAPLVAPIVAGLPHVRETVVFRGGHEGLRRWDDVLAMGSPAEPPPPADYGAAMMYTSGTTGRPKGAIRTRSDRALLGSMLAQLRFGAGEVHITTGPLYHAGPNAFALLTHITGGTIVVQRAFDPAAWLRLVAEHRVTSTFAAPTHLKRIVSLPDEVLADADMSSMRTLIANAAPVPYALKQEVVAKLGDGFLFEVYGSTELGIVTVLVPEDQLRKPGSCGRPYGGIELKAVDDDGADLPAGEAGELFIRTALAIDRYHGAGEQMAELPGEWKSVGDIGWVDDEGYVHVCDRKGDLIITGGMNVYPAEVEAVLHGCPGVMDAAVFGVPDDDWGERVHAVVQPRPGQSLDVDTLEAAAATSLAGFKRPRSWEIRDSLPRTDSGKLLKRLLRDEHWAERGARI